MSVTFTKLFSSITESTVWCEPDRTRLVWICMLAMADRHGRVYGSIPGLANRARVPVDDARKAIETFLQPDIDSRTKEHDGRRISEMDGGWRLLNHAKYRDIRDEESILESKRKYINNRRAAERAAASTVDQSRSDVDRSRANAEAYTEAEADTKKDRVAKATPATFVAPDWVPAAQWQDFTQMRKAMRGVPFTPAAAKRVVAELGRLCDQGHDAAELLGLAVMNGWRTVYPPKQGTGQQAGAVVNKQEALEQRNREVAARWVAKMEAQHGTN